MPPVIIADRYHVLRELGRGGMGVVYQVVHKQTGEHRALKVLLAHKAAKGESVERFKRELKLPARIKSEHVVQVVDSGEVKEEGDAPFYVMELLRGCDLRKLLDGNHAFKPREVIWILRQLAQGLSRAHEIGIVHRDLKPDNIFLHHRDDKGLVVKILDFGIARYAQELLETSEKGKLTATQAMLGTPLYMAPEQAKAGEGRAEIGPCTDVWAVGMIVFELLTGKTYWTADSVMQHVGQLLFAPMATASQRAKDLPPGFDAWFARSCNRDASKRYKSVGEQIHDLAKVLSAPAVDREPTSALVTAVKKQLPPELDNRSHTMSEDGETYILDQNKLLLGSAEQNLRAELFPGHPVKHQTGSAIAAKLKSRIVLGGTVLLGVGTMALVILGSRPGVAPKTSTMAPDMAAEVVDLAPRRDLSAAPDPEPAPSAHKPSSDSKRHRGSKAAKTAAPDETTTKPRRTYIPPSL